MDKKLSLEDLRLVKATTEQWRKIQEYHVHLWGGGVSIDDYQKRKTFLCVDSAFSKKGNFTGWVLVPKDHPKTLTQMLSFCDTYNRPIYIKNEQYPNGAELQCTCIVSVAKFGISPVHARVISLPQISCVEAMRQLTAFTSEHRGKGYAKQMLTLLHEEMAKASIMSILYSDVGDYYARVKRVHPDPNKRIGWNIISPMHVVWPADTDFGSDGGLDAKASKIHEEDLQALCEYDARLLKQEVTKAEGPAFIVIPTEDQLEWELRRTKFFDELRHPPARYEHPKIDHWGCKIGNIGDEDFAFAVWHCDIIVNELNILRLSCKSVKQLEALLRKAQEEAISQGMKLITAWNVHEKLLEGTGWRNEMRKEHLSAVAWYGEGPVPAWICNENWIRC